MLSHFVLFAVWIHVGIGSSISWPVAEREWNNVAEYCIYSHGSMQCREGIFHQGSLLGLCLWARLQDVKVCMFVCLFVWLYAPLRFFPTNLSTLCMNYLPKTYNNWLTILVKYKCFVLGLFHMNVRILTSVFSAARDAQVFPYRNVQATCWYQWQATGQRDLHESPHVVCLHIRPSLRCPRRCVCGGPCSQLPVIDFNRLPAGLGMEKPADLSVYLCTPHGRANLETDC